MRPRTITNALGETVERTWTDEDLDRLIDRCGLDRIEVSAAVAGEIARLVRRGAAPPTLRSRPRKGGPEHSSDRPATDESIDGDRT